MRNFGATSFGGWYNSKKTDHARYAEFLTRLKAELDRLGRFRQRDAVYQMYINIKNGSSPVSAQNASKTSGYNPPLYSDFMSVWNSSGDLDVVVAHFAGAAGTDSGSTSTSMTIQEMAQAEMASRGGVAATVSPEERYQSLLAFCQKTMPADHDCETSILNRMAANTMDPAVSAYAQAVLAGAVAPGEPISSTAADAEGEESFFSAYKTPLILAGVALGLGGSLWFASRKGWI